MSSDRSRFERTSPSALTFAKLLGDGPMARVALEASLAELRAAAFIVSKAGTVLHMNEEGAKRAAGSTDRLRAELARAVKSLGDENEAGPALVTPLRCESTEEYFLVVFREPASPQENVAWGASLWELTPRQTEVLSLLSEGFSNKTIAARLGCAERTVEAHLTAIFDKSGFKGRTELLAAMARNNTRKA
jgi:DNA-binding NarL/FixJ family response regulator